MRKRGMLLSIWIVLFSVSPILMVSGNNQQSGVFLKVKINQANRVEAFNTLILELTGISDNTTKMNKINEFMTVQQSYGFPVTYDDEIIFLYRTNNTLMVEVGGRMTQQVTLDHVDGTDLFYKQFTFHNDSRGNYWFREDGTSMLKDPLNPDTIIVGQEFTVVSDFKMPQYFDDGSYLFNDNIGSVMV
ncbi:MAG: hypothetical protein ACFFAJ_13180, partial [Candidatus Hodarchaeota archaeon]